MRKRSDKHRSGRNGQSHRTQSPGRTVKNGSLISPMKPRRAMFLRALAVAGTVAVIGIALWQGRPEQTVPERSRKTVEKAVAPAPTYVGEQVCADCHQEENRLWRGSHHELAMRPASEETVAGDFDNASFTYAGATTIFFRRDGRFMVRTDGPDGQLCDYEIRYTFGATPLQQYLIPLPGGRLQALGIAWDTRPKAEGGQRWFHLYPDQNVTHSHPLHWTGLNQNWNYMCAECHSTNVKKNYELKARHYSTTFSEVNVSCEACHGPGSNHVAWAKKEGDGQHHDDGSKGLVIALNERKSVQWMPNPESGNAVRSAPRRSTREIEMCARCHSRRGPISEDYGHGRPLGDTHRLALLEDGLYYPDGQMRDEVYVYGSFLQSKMFRHGVTCSDCHEPHSLGLRAPEGEVCLQCHEAGKYESPKHHFHPLNSRGADCIECHMPATTYMIVDPRHDHGFRVPRPDLSVKLGTPNACNRCHADHSPAWAAKRVEQWYGHTPEGYQRYAEILHDGSTGAPGVVERLLGLAEDKSQPAIARASALARLDRVPNPRSLSVIGRQLRDDDPLVREAAAGALEGAEPQTRFRFLADLLRDRVRAVRIEAARVLADVPAEHLMSEQRTALTRGIAEYMAAQRLNADRPEAHLNLAQVHAAQRRFDRAEAALRTALELDPGFVPASVNLADLYRALGRDTEGESVLREALRRSPESAALHHAVGLLRVRQKRMSEALAELKLAVSFDRGNARYAYVYGVALNGVGQAQKAIAMLQSALRQHPFDRDLLFALASIYRDNGQPHKALSYARTLAELEPENPERAALVAELQEQGRRKSRD
jgi:predicted CXXCH cytochrome family protein